MRSTFRGAVMAGVLAAAGTSAVGVSAARACDHGPPPGFGPGPPWGYGGVAPAAVRFGGLPDYDHCPVCRPRVFAPPPCPPPPCGDGYDEAGVYGRVIYREYRRADFPAAYPAPPAPYATPQATATYGAPYYPSAPLAPPAKQAPGVYGTPQYPDPAAGSPGSFGVPQAQASYPTQEPAADYGRVPPSPTPYAVPRY